MVGQVSRLAAGVIQVLGRLVLFVFERYWDVHAANRWIPTLIPAGVLALLIGGLSPAATLVVVSNSSLCDLLVWCCVGLQ